MSGSSHIKILKMEKRGKGQAMECEEWSNGTVALTPIFQCLRKMYLCPTWKIKIKGKRSQ